MKRAVTDTRKKSLSPAGHRPSGTLVAVTQSPITRSIMSVGIRKLHSAGCPGRDGRRCVCGAGYEASVFSKRDGKKIRKTFPNKAEAKTWRNDANAALSKGGLRAPRPTTVKEAWEAWYEAAKEGIVRNRKGDHFKPSALRSYESSMRLRVLPLFGETRVADLDRPELQRYVYRLLEEGHAPTTIDGTLLPLRALCRQAVERGELAVNPCSGLAMPRGEHRRDRIADPAEAAALLAALSADDRPLWGTALYAGLRRGELQALRAKDVDLATGVIRVERGWDPQEGPIELKTAAGRRRVPIPAVLRDYLVEHRAANSQRIQNLDSLVFGETRIRPFDGRLVQRRADAAWKEARLERITFHECRHTFASLMIAAGVNAKALSVFMGHSSITITMDRYGHLMPGSEEEAAGLLDAYLDAQRGRAEDQARSAAVAI